MRPLPSSWKEWQATMSNGKQVHAHTARIVERAMVATLTEAWEREGKASLTDDEMLDRLQARLGSEQLDILAEINTAELMRRAEVALLRRELTTAARASGYTLKQFMALSNKERAEIIRQAYVREFGEEPPAGQ